MKSGITAKTRGSVSSSRTAATATIGRRDHARHWALSVMVAGLTILGVTTAATPSFANLFDRVYEDNSRQAVLETASGQYNAGVSLLRTVQNYAGAAKWFRRAADRGHPNAQAVLGSLYAVGLGVPKDFVNAYAWVSLALPRLEGRMRDRAVALQDELSALMTPAQIGKAQRIAGDWRPQAR